MVRNKPKRIISTSGELTLWQMILELVIKQCETPVRVGLNPLHSRHILKPWARTNEKRIRVDFNFSSQPMDSRPEAFNQKALFRFESDLKISIQTPFFMEICRENCFFFPSSKNIEEQTSWLNLQILHKLNIKIERTELRTQCSIQKQHQISQIISS